MNDDDLSSAISVCVCVNSDVNIICFDLWLADTHTDDFLIKSILVWSWNRWLVILKITRPKIVYTSSSLPNPSLESFSTALVFVCVCAFACECVSMCGSSAFRSVKINSRVWKKRKRILFWLFDDFYLATCHWSIFDNPSTGVQKWIETTTCRFSAVRWRPSAGKRGVGMMKLLTKRRRDPSSHLTTSSSSVTVLAHDMFLSSRCRRAFRFFIWFFIPIPNNQTNKTRGFVHLDRYGSFVCQSRFSFDQSDDNRFLSPLLFRFFVSSHQMQQFNVGFDPSQTDKEGKVGDLLIVISLQRLTVPCPVGRRVLIFFLVWRPAHDRITTSVVEVGRRGERQEAKCFFFFGPLKWLIACATHRHTPQNSRHGHKERVHIYLVSSRYYHNLCLYNIYTIIDSIQSFPNRSRPARSTLTLFFWFFLSLCVCMVV